MNVLQLIFFLIKIGKIVYFCAEEYKCTKRVILWFVMQTCNVQLHWGFSECVCSLCDALTLFPVCLLSKQKNKKRQFLEKLKNRKKGWKKYVRFKTVFVILLVWFENYWLSILKEHAKMTTTTTTTTPTTFNQIKKKHTGWLGITKRKQKTSEMKTDFLLSYTL